MNHLTRDRVDGLRGLGNASRHGGDHHVDRDGKESGENSGERVLGATVLGYLDDLINDEANDVHPRHRRRERETGDNRVKRLGLELLGNKGNSLHSRLHRECYIIQEENYLFRK